MKELNNFYDALPDNPWPSHRKGEEKRRKILEFLRENPNISTDEIACKLNLSTQQVKRHRRILYAEGLWVSTFILFFAFFPGAYYPAVHIDKTEEDHIKSSTFSTKQRRI